MSQAATISSEELARQLKVGVIGEFWNVLTDDYFKGELIPGSRRVPLDQVGREISRLKLAKDAAITVYCSDPDCPQSGAAAEKLVTLGYTNVQKYPGGLQEWKASGRGVETLPPTANAA
jgi:rhodanese-related sulfurtransferase